MDYAKLQNFFKTKNMKKNISKLLVHAENAVTSTLLKNKKENGLIHKYIPKEYKGYISSFGAAIIQSGLLPALYFNHGSEGSTEDREKLMDAVFYILKNGYNITASENNLLKYAKEQARDNELKKVKNQILDAATALKLVIRTYKLV